METRTRRVLSGRGASASLRLVPITVILAEMNVAARTLHSSIGHTMIIRRIAPLSCAKIAGTIYGALGLLVGAVIALVSTLGSAFAGARAHTMSPLLGLFMGVGAILVCPVFYGILGFLSAYVGAWIYNLVASRIGGIEIDLA